ncbi:hypothetical protein J3A83DRAFT_1725367 [Scleroderma citrinum]
MSREAWTIWFSSIGVFALFETSGTFMCPLDVLAWLSESFVSSTRLQPFLCHFQCSACLCARSRRCAASEGNHFIDTPLESPLRTYVLAVPLSCRFESFIRKLTVGNARHACVRTRCVCVAHHAVDFICAMSPTHVCSITMSSRSISIFLRSFALQMDPGQLHAKSCDSSRQLVSSTLAMCLYHSAICEFD